MAQLDVVQQQTDPSSAPHSVQPTAVAADQIHIAALQSVQNLLNEEKLIYIHSIFNSVTVAIRLYVIQCSSSAPCSASAPAEYHKVAKQSGPFDLSNEDAVKLWHSGLKEMDDAQIAYQQKKVEFRKLYKKGFDKTIEAVVKLYEADKTKFCVNIRQTSFNLEKIALEKQRLERLQQQLDQEQQQLEQEQQHYESERIRAEEALGGAQMLYRKYKEKAAILKEDKMAYQGVCNVVQQFHAGFQSGK